MAVSEERLDRWRERRTGRLTERGLLRAQTRGDGPAAFYVADELLVREEHHRAAEDILTSRGHTDLAEATLTAPGLRRYRATGLDVLTTVATIGRHAVTVGDERPAASPNHVFLGAPFEHGGPFGPPTPSEPGADLVTTGHQGQVRVAVVDTGVWLDSPLPPGRYEADPVDVESDVDVDQDGVLDGDVGHANFIAGVIALNAPATRIRILKVLDTFGMCTESDLVDALGRIDPATALVNLSLGGYTVDDQPPLALRDALDRLMAGADRAVVTAAGNDGQRLHPFWPAAFSGSTEAWRHRVLAVAAHDGTRLASWTNTGDWVSLAAPGADVVSTYVHHERFTTGWAQWSGTSFATPYVVAALARKINGSDSPHRVAQALERVRAQAAQHSYDGLPGLA